MIEQDRNIVRYGNITATPYEIDYIFWDEDEIKVWVSNSDGDTLLTKGTDYTISGTYVTLTASAVTAYGSYTTLSIQRDLSLVQNTDYLNGTNINADILEANLDKITAMIQQLSERDKRALKTSISEVGSDITLPDVASRINMLMGFGSDGKTIILRSLTQFDLDVLAAASNAALAVSSKESAADSATLAQEWASKFNALDPSSTEPVAYGKYSAMYEAYKADMAKQAAVSAKNDAITYAGAASDARDAAVVAKNKAEKWSEESEDIEVETGKYSAKHWAKKAEAQVATITDDAARAEAARDRAEEWASNSEDVPVVPGYYSARHHALKAAAYANVADQAKADAVTAKDDAVEAKNNAVIAAQTAVGEGIDSITEYESGDQKVISIIQRNGTTKTFSLTQGAKGDKGDKGDTGESGVVAPIASFFTLSVDADGNLWAHHADNEYPPDLEYDSDTGNLYINT